ncbi:polysaccharide deacetylase family protein [Zoogloea sp.]|uniref:polysaccharide deacetylase family protein n=1 Tax=Zoogloea sp. TaxID=49181 RepID=UPI0025CC7D2E|nr:polysaccharide deacetylase family protein [Zoogloea sp.]MCK6393540.1 polysaccharide deacetylase family protein [Zoogloea sp.]
MTQVQILMYHRVGHFPGRVKAHGALYCHLPRFRAQMRLFKVLGYSVVSLDDAAAGLRGELALPPRPLVLTFDDAYVDFLDNAAPVLKAHGYPATVYAVSSLIGTTSSWDAGVGPEPAPLMNAAQLREVQSLGFTIGSHSKSHLRLAQQDDACILAEVRDSKLALEDLLGRRVDHFCYPYGSHDLRAVHAAAEAGYLTGTTCVRAAATPADDPLTLPRKAVSRGDDVFGVAWKLLTKNLPKVTPIRR